MLYADGVIAVALLCLWVYCLLDVLTSAEAAVRNLPKWAWFVVVLLFGEIGVGPVLWLVAGRPRRGGQPGRPPGAGEAGPRPAPERPVAQHPDDDEAFLRGLRERAEEQRRRAAEQQRSTEDDPLG